MLHYSPARCYGVLHLYKHFYPVRMRDAVDLLLSKQNENDRRLWSHLVAI